LLQIANCNFLRFATKWCYKLNLWLQLVRIQRMKSKDRLFVANSDFLFFATCNNIFALFKERIEYLVEIGTGEVVVRYREERGTRLFWICPSLMARGCRKSATMTRPAPHQQYLHFSRNDFHQSRPRQFLRGWKYCGVRSCITGILGYNLPRVRSGYADRTTSFKTSGTGTEVHISPLRGWAT
jgi:hypothetical protein